VPCCSDSKKKLLPDLTLQWLTGCVCQTTIRAGEGIIASNLSANRDEDVFPDPDKFDMHRKFSKDGLGFGFGPHRCIAEHLAKAELTTAFGECRVI